MARDSSTRSTAAFAVLWTTIRTLRTLAVAHRLGHVLMGEQEREGISLLQRVVEHAMNTARYNI
jgi:hypothetical protein